MLIKLIKDCHPAGWQSRLPFMPLRAWRSRAGKVARGREAGSDGPMASIGIPSIEHNLRLHTMNVKGEMKGDILTLTIDVSKVARDKAPLSKSEKSRLLASTSGFTTFGDVKVSLNATIDK